jgi:hypothetical protein
MVVVSPSSGWLCRAEGTLVMPLEPKRVPLGAPSGIDLPGARAGSRRVVYLGLLMFGTLACSALPLPWQMGGLAFAGAAIVVGVMALRSLRRAHVRGILPAVVVLALVFSGLSVLSYGATAIFWTVSMQRQDCLRDAITVSAQAQCETDYRNALQAKLDQLTGASRPSTPSTP